MAIVTAWWGIWHIFAGMALSTFWMSAPARRRRVDDDGAARVPRHRRRRLPRQPGRRRARRARRGNPSCAWTCANCPLSAAPGGVVYAAADIRDRAPLEPLREHRIDTVVHLAAIVTPGRSRTATEYQVDVVGTKNVLDACVAAGVGHVVISSSARPTRLPRRQPGLADRGRRDPRQPGVRLLLAQAPGRGDARRLPPDRAAAAADDLSHRDHPRQRRSPTRSPPSSTSRGRWRSRARTPFVFIWDQDVVGAILHSLAGGPPASTTWPATGADDPRDRGAHGQSAAECCRRPCCRRRCGSASVCPASRNTGPEQLRFLRYRPVLANTRLKTVFGYVPRKTSAEVFDFWWTARRAWRRHPDEPARTARARRRRHRRRRRPRDGPVSATPQGREGRGARPRRCARRAPPPRGCARRVPTRSRSPATSPRRRRVPRSRRRSALGGIDILSTTPASRRACCATRRQRSRAA